jgi:hypothetical protein
MARQPNEAFRLEQAQRLERAKAEMAALRRAWLWRGGWWHVVKHTFARWLLSGYAAQIDLARGMESARVRLHYMAEGAYLMRTEAAKMAEREGNMRLALDIRSLPTDIENLTMGRRDA